MADRTFGPAVALGVLGSALAATAGHRDWVELTAPGAGQGAVDWFWQNNPGVGQMPASGALGLVALATWGVLLVSRGTWRRVVAAVGLLAVVGLAVTWVVGATGLRDDVEDRVVGADLSVGWQLGWTTWFVLAGIAVLLLLPAHVLALLRAPHWPAMGSRYDAPTAKEAGDPGEGPLPATGRTPSPSVDPTDEETDPADVWKAIDEGRDPTA